MPTLYVLSLFTTLSSNKAISKRLTTQRGATNLSGFQPGRLATSYAQHSFVAVAPSAAPVKVGFGAPSVKVEEKEGAEKEGS